MSPSRRRYLTGPLIFSTRVFSGSGEVDGRGAAKLKGVSPLSWPSHLVPDQVILYSMFSLQNIEADG
jgi:hypothetical protein